LPLLTIANNRPFGIRFLSNFTSYPEAASFIGNPESYDGLLKLKKKLGAKSLRSCDRDKSSPGRGIKA